MMKNVLIVEDEKSILDYVAKELMFEDYEVSTASDGLEALVKFDENEFDVVLLDWMLPKLDGLEVLKRMKQSKPAVPIIFLTARDFVADKVSGLDAGADDYMTKPFEIEELFARLRLIFRKSSAKTIYQIGHLTVDVEMLTVKSDGKIINLTQREFALLQYLLENQGKIVSRADILDDVWGMNSEAQENTVDAYIRYLRAKLDKTDEKSLIETIRGIGYRIS